MRKLLLLLMICFMAVLNARTVSSELRTLPERAKTELFQQRKKTVSVKSYKRKNGTVVKAHKRRAPRRH